METCENCGAMIGDLETPCLWDNHIVCADCHAKLGTPSANAHSSLPATPSLPPYLSRAASTRPAHLPSNANSSDLKAIRRNLNAIYTVILIVIIIAALWLAASYYQAQEIRQQKYQDYLEGH
jgi:hypothetical protein